MVAPRLTPEDPYSKIWQYANLPGEIVSSNSVPSQDSKTCDVDSSSGPFEALREEYTVRLDMGVEIEHVAPECLEIIERPQG